MERDCTAIQEDLVEVGGRQENLAQKDLEHLARCQTCLQVAEEESHLSRIFKEALPPSDGALQERILASLNRARLRRRVLALLPVASSLVVALAGIALFGSLPGSSLFTQLPRWSSAGWLNLASTLRDWQIALTTAAASAASAISPATLMLASLLCLSGIAAIVVLTRAWQRNSSWQRQKR